MTIKPTPLKRALFFIFFDILLSLGTLFLAYNLRFNFSVDTSYLDNFLLVFVVLVFFKIGFIAFFNIYKVSWRFFSLGEVKKIFYAHILAYPLVVLIYYLIPEYFTPFPRSVLMIDIFLSIIFLGFFRVLKRLIIENDSNVNLKKTLIIGANSFAQSIIKDKENYYVSAVVDDDENVVGSHFSNIEVAHLKDIKEMVMGKNIQVVLIAKSFEIEKLNSIYEQLKEISPLDIKLVSFADKEKVLKSLTVEDLLARHPKDLDKKKIGEFIKNKTILVTGAGGSIGSEICRQCEKFGAKKLILLDNCEFNLYTIAQELKKIQSVCVMQNITDKGLLEETFKLHMPEIVIHAAAYKHVPLVELNVYEAIVNNVVGTKNVIDVSIQYGVKKFVMISTDKAVRPTNVMGTTKRICELYAQNSNTKGTDIVAVRFGNVLGSSGSAIPKFKSQIEKGQNITVTHPEITRYFMLIPEACELVLQAAAIGTGGEIFILDMGEPIKIVDLARKMIELSGRENIGIEFIGLRPGEKLYEELLIDETDAKTDYDSITVAAPTKYDINKLNKDIQELLACANTLEKLKEIVPEFNHQLNEVKELQLV
ncbi:polysaccharide biosynthesis protein [bacterium]|nr:polysaccharide biosynthesis protein [bacterium]MBU1995148.1 polysaccharide biosynthesis protein [bacterium]